MGLIRKYKKEHGLEEKNVSADDWKYDPRPDLKDDHKYWAAVLRLAEKMNDEIYYVLAGVRCMGNRLEIVGNFLRLVDGGECGPAEYKEMREQHLKPHADQIVEIFKKASAEVT